MKLPPSPHPPFQPAYSDVERKRRTLLGSSKVALFGMDFSGKRVDATPKGFVVRYSDGTSGKLLVK